MLSPDRLCELLPHAGAMCLIQELLEWDEEHIVCRTRSHLAPDNPLRQAETLHAIHAAEYGAQAVGLHGGLLAERAGAPANSGLLAGLRQVKLYRARLDDSEAPLTIRAHRLLADPHNLLYAFAMDLNREPVAEGRIAIITQ